MATKQTLIALAFSVALATAAQAECLTDAQAADMVAHYVARTPAANPENLSDADGACSRAKLNQLLAQRVGKVIGYKAGLTNPAVQKRFNTDKPVWGKLYEGMVLQNGATVDAAFGARPLYEADMLVRVKSAAINHARTPMDVLEAVDQIIPFIELPDLMVQAPPKLNGAGVSAINVGARLGVAGSPLAVPAYRAERYALLQALADMSVSLTDGTGARLGGGKGSDILGIRSAPWCGWPVRWPRRAWRCSRAT
jgi:2-keto-4-pentenoate hydratase